MLSLSLSLCFYPDCTSLTPCFCTETLVRCTNMLSSSLILALYLTVQNRQNPSRYLWSSKGAPTTIITCFMEAIKQKELAAQFLQCDFIAVQVYTKSGLKTNFLVTSSNLY